MKHVYLINKFLELKLLFSYNVYIIYLIHNNISEQIYFQTDWKGCFEGQWLDKTIAKTLKAYLCFLNDNNTHKQWFKCVVMVNITAFLRNKLLVSENKIKINWIRILRYATRKIGINKKRVCRLQRNLIWIIKQFILIIVYNYIHCIL